MWFTLAQTVTCNTIKGETRCGPSQPVLSDKKIKHKVGRETVLQT